MKATVLYDNNAPEGQLLGGHGFSVFLESTGRKILMDTGVNPDFLSNAMQLGIDLEAVEYVVISHGHYDHTGGLKAFLALNSKAKVIIHKKAFGEFMSTKNGAPEFIGMDSELEIDSRFVLIDETYDIAPDIRVFPGKIGADLLPKGNDKLYINTTSGLRHDDFRHEISLILNVGDRTLLVSGCSHGGIVNIVNKANRLSSNPVTHVLAGLHLKGMDASVKEDREFFDGLAAALEGLGIEDIYTCHCTGGPATAYLVQYKNFHETQVGTVISI